MHHPLLPHWQAVKRILRYLKHIISYSLLISKHSSMNIAAYSESDWAGDFDDRRYTSAYCIFIGKNLISWSSRKQQTVARSSTEAEYKSLANAAPKVQLLQSLLSELGCPSPRPPFLWYDNIGANYLSSNPVFQARTKHIEIDFHFVWDHAASK
jgi:hypothetical protein